MPKAPLIIFERNFSFTVTIDGETFVATKAKLNRFDSGKHIAEISVGKRLASEGGMPKPHLERYWTQEPHDVEINCLDREGHTYLTYRLRQAKAKSFTDGEWQADGGPTALIVEGGRLSDEALGVLEEFVTEQRKNPDPQAIVVLEVEGQDGRPVRVTSTPLFGGYVLQETIVFEAEALERDFHARKN